MNEYQRGVREALVNVQQSIDDTKGRGLSPLTFFVGMVNIALTSFILGRYPENYWLLHCFKAMMLGITAFRMKRSRNELFFLFDFCWVMNCMLLIVSICQGIEVLYEMGFIKFPGEAILNLTEQPAFGRGAFVMSCGPIAAYSLILGPPLVLHDMNHFINFFIHITPLLLMWSLRWHKEDVDKQWPNCFVQYHVMPTDPGAFGFWEVCHLSMGAYACWWVPFTLWMLVHGRFQGKNDNDHGQDTVYHLMIRGATGKMLGICSSSKDHAQHRKQGSQVLPVLKYMAAHAVCCNVAILSGTLCYFSFWYHTVFGCLCMLRAAWGGSVFYYKIMTKFPVKALENMLKDVDKTDNEAPESATKGD